MSSLGTVETNLPPGFRFHPRDDELICDYLMKWLTTGSCSHQDATTPPLLIQVDLNKVEPWEIPETACVGGKEWYFYSQREKKYATGIRTNRATVSGYWKATGKDRPVLRNEALVGMRKTLVFYQGRAPKGRKTDWVMHELRLEGPSPELASSVKKDWVICRVSNKTRTSEGAAKQETRIKSNEDTFTSLTEPYNVTFDPINQSKAPVTINLYHNQSHQQQVPCFSIFNTPNQTSPNFSSLSASIGPRIISSINGIWPGNIGNINPCSNSTEESSDGYTSEVELSNYVWNY